MHRELLLNFRRVTPPFRGLGGSLNINALRLAALYQNEF
jgi:hypothetical protein